MLGENVQSYIKRFLTDYPSGRLCVMVGYASVWGLAWLQENTHQRPVTLMIGDTKPHHFQRATDSDRSSALAFLQRPDVKVLNWYRTGRSSLGASRLHAKGWIVTDRKGRSAVAGVAGSANLTRKGLVDNWEMVTAIDPKELPRIWAQFDGFQEGRTVKNKPWDARKGLTEAIKAGEEGRQQTKPPQQQKPSEVKRRGGCLTLAAMLSAISAVIITAVLSFLL